MSEPAIKVIAMPSDTNPDGDMFGGWIVSQMDLAGYLTARKIARKKLATVAIDDIVFHAPVFVGDCLECFTRVEKTGRTSITVTVEAYVERKDKSADEPKEKVTEGRFVFVAIDKDRKPSPIHA
ncbi:MAG: acyl-CoA thioesterase [Alphaproteobacteria bacterium]|nr:acyl-CoA thioesterase [Alphaproteobacteria bacterium]